MSDYNTHNVILFNKEIDLIRLALISMEAEERSLMRSYEGTVEYYEHYGNVKSIERLRDKIESIM
jgi:hypothetical protein